MRPQFFFVNPYEYMAPTFPTVANYSTYFCPLINYQYILPFEQQPIFYQAEQQMASAQLQSVKNEEISSSKPVSQAARPKSRFKYPKKNVQSNVVNQCYSFLITKAKSYPIVRKVLGTEQKIDAFYDIMKQGRKKHTTYMGRKVLQNLLQINDTHPISTLFKKLKDKLEIRIGQIKRAISILISYFFANVIVPTILTSTKLDKNTIRQHITRAREISQYLNYTASTSF